MPLAKKIQSVDDRDRCVVNRRLLLWAQGVPLRYTTFEGVENGSRHWIDHARRHNVLFPVEARRRRWTVIQASRGLYSRGEEISRRGDLRSQRTVGDSGTARRGECRQGEGPHPLRRNNRIKDFGYQQDSRP